MKLGIDTVLSALKRVAPLLKPLEDLSQARKIYALIPSTPGHDMPELLNGVPEASLTELQPDGQTIVHRLATYRALHYLPVNSKTSAVFAVKSSTDETPLHAAAYHGSLDQIPKRILTREALLMKDQSGATVIHAAAWAGSIQQLPQENLRVSDLELRLLGGKTLVHRAADKGYLERLPAGWVTRTTMTARDDNESTPVHQAALSGNLEKVPREFLTYDLLTMKDNDGDSPLSYAVDNEEVGCIPDLSYPGYMKLKHEVQQQWLDFFDENCLTGEALKEIKTTWANLERSGNWQSL